LAGGIVNDGVDSDEIVDTIAPAMRCIDDHPAKPPDKLGLSTGTMHGMEFP
jgi:hypothetical protein